MNYRALSQKKADIQNNEYGFDWITLNKGYNNKNPLLILKINDLAAI